MSEVRSGGHPILVRDQNEREEDGGNEKKVGDGSYGGGGL